jgi:hypothetical protein
MICRPRRAATTILLSIMVAGSSSLGCGQFPDELPEVTQLIVWNRSEFELLELYVTPDTRYLGATNLLEQPLPDEDDITVAFSQSEYVTVVRRRVEAGERIALTTAEPVEPEADKSTLIVFQESFRLQTPDAISRWRPLGRD